MSEDDDIVELFVVQVSSDGRTWSMFNRGHCREVFASLGAARYAVTQLGGKYKRIVRVAGEVVE